MPDIGQIHTLIAETINDLLSERQALSEGQALSERPVEPGETVIGFDPATVLYGEAGIMDSMGLVMLVAEIEQRLEDDFDRSLVLADERAIARHRSPFRTADALAAYIMELLDEPT